MGLDQYAYVAAKASERAEYYEAEEGEFIDGEWKVPGKSEPREIAYWRKHPNLQGWMEHLWHKKRNAEGNPVVEDADDMGTFNGVELELTWQDIDELENAVKKRKLPSTQGFFFGNDADQYYYDQDLEFIKNARAELFLGLKVFYNSSW
jgi:hypothetical protein